METQAAVQHKTVPPLESARLMFVKLNGFEEGYKLLDNAGLDRTSREQDNTILRQWWWYLKISDLDHKTKQFQRKLSRNGLNTGILLHEIDPEIAEHVTFIK